MYYNGDITQVYLAIAIRSRKDSRINRHLANSWGSDENGSGLGFGPQEEFYGCADISVYSKSNNHPPTTTHRVTTTRPGTILTRPTIAPTTPPSVTDGNFCSDKANGLYQHKKCTKFYQEYFQPRPLRRHIRVA